MPLSAPTKLSTVWNATGVNRNTIPVASQIGITNGLASYTDGFPPNTMLPTASGGVPPFGQDFNGILYAVTQALQWLQAGAGYAYDSTYATAIGGYPINAIVQRSDNLGFWLNTSANNSTNPESGGAGWVPLSGTGSAAVMMTNANVTLTSLQGGQDIIVISGALTANLNLVFPTYTKRWMVVNNGTGAYTVTAKTASGSGVAIATGTTAHVWGDGTNIYYGEATITQVVAQTGTAFTTAGTAPNFTLTPSPALPAYNGLPRYNVTFNAAGTTGSNTLNISGLGAKNLKQYDANGAKQPAVITANWTSDVQYDGTDLVVLDPVSSKTSVVSLMRNGKMSVTATSASGTFTADEIIVETALGGVAYQLASYSQVINLATTGAGGMDTGSAPVSGYVALYAIYNPTTNTRNILATNTTSAVAPNVYGGANMPAGYTASALISVWPTNASSQFVAGKQTDRKFWLANVQVLNTSTGQASYTSLSISGAAPQNAIEVSGFGLISASSSSSVTLNIAASTTGIGQQVVTNTSGTTTLQAEANFDCPIITAQTLYWNSTNSGTIISIAIYLTGYVF